MAAARRPGLGHARTLAYSFSILSCISFSLHIIRRSLYMNRGVICAAITAIFASCPYCGHGRHARIVRRNYGNGHGGHGGPAITAVSAVSAVTAPWPQCAARRAEARGGRRRRCASETGFAEPVVTMVTVVMAVTAVSAAWPPFVANTGFAEPVSQSCGSVVSLPECTLIR